jgi:MGT family glycosyltransferase
MRVLLVSWDGGGNLPPALVLGERLAERGHEVRLLGNASQERAALGAGCEFVSFERAPDCDSRRPETDLLRDWEIKPGPKLFARLRERLLFGPAGAYAADVLAELDRAPVDVVAADFLLFGALAAAERADCAAVGLVHTVYALPRVSGPPFGSGFALATGFVTRARERVFRSLSSRLWNKGLPALNAARTELGLDPLADVFDQLDRLDRVLVLGSDAFDFAALCGARLPENVRYVGPQVKLADRLAEREHPPLVLVSFSTTYQAQRPLLERVLEALASLPVRALLTTGPAVELDGAVPPNVRVQRWVDHREVLPGASLVITHGGMGTVMASLAHGVPVVCLPMGRDQPDVAARLIHSGAGVRVRSRASAAQIAAAVRGALADPGLYSGARRLRRAIGAELDGNRAVAEIEALADLGRGATTRPTPRD